MRLIFVQSDVIKYFILVLRDCCPDMPCATSSLHLNEKINLDLQFYQLLLR